MSSKLRHIFILANMLWVVIIFILCAMPSDNIPDPHWNIPHLDKVVHFGMYFVLSILLIFPLEEYSCLKLSRIYLIAILVALIWEEELKYCKPIFSTEAGMCGIWSQIFQAVLQAVCVILL
ncbi:MAG: VanZ family protein [Odoribacter splanchnicus]